MKKPIDYRTEKELIYEMIRDDPFVTHDEIIKACLERNPNSKVKRQHINWHKTMMRKQTKDAIRRERRRFLDD